MKTAMLILAAVLSLAAVTVRAQTQAGDITVLAGQNVSGTLQTADGAAITGKEVKFLDANGNVVASSVSDATGAYSVNLPAGQYSMVVAGEQLATVTAVTAGAAAAAGTVAATSIPVVATSGALIGGTAATVATVAGVAVVGAGAAVAADEATQNDDAS